MDLDEIQLTAEEAMEKAVEYLRGELRGVRTGQGRRPGWSNSSRWTITARRRTCGS